MHLQDFLAALQVGQLHRYPAVKPAGTGQGGIQRLGPVGRRQNNNAVVCLKAVHLGQQLVQRLLPLVIAAVLAAVALLADGVDLINKDDAGGFFLGLVKQVAHLGSAHADEHFHEFGAGNGKERDVGFAGDRLGQHGLAGSGRADQQDALGHGGTDLPVFAGIVQVVYDLLQVFLGLVFAGYIGKADAVGGRDVDLGARISRPEHHGVPAAHFIGHSFHHILAQGDDENDRKHPGQQKAHHGGGFLDDFAGEFCPGIV